jgi:hypothetical protein
MPIGLQNTGEAATRLLAGQGRGGPDLVQALAGVAGLPIKGRPAPGFVGEIDPGILRAVIFAQPPSLGDPTNLLAGQL